MYLSRRDFIRAAGVIAGSVALAACAPKASESHPTRQRASRPREPLPAALRLPSRLTAGGKDELGDPVNPFEAISPTTTTTTSSPPTKKAWPRWRRTSRPRPGTWKCRGLVNKPSTFGMEDLIKRFPPEERIYRLRCVEAWCMVIPWMGFPLPKLLKEVEPTVRRQICALRDHHRPGADARPEQPVLPLALPGRPAPGRSHERPDHPGHRPVRQASCPPRTAAASAWWCRGSTASRASRPSSRSSWSTNSPPPCGTTIAPNEYGFYANVNPEVDHPRWSQATERRIGELRRRPTLHVQRLCRTGRAAV